MVVRSYSGLMSRIRMLYDAYLTVKKYEKNPRLTILWESQDGCNINYDDVFESNQFSDVELKIVEVDKDGYWKGKSIRNSLMQGKLLDVLSEVKHRVYLKRLYSFYSRGREIVRYNDNPEAVWTGDFTNYNRWKENKWKKIKQLCKEHKRIYIDCYESFIVPRDTTKIAEVIKFKKSYIDAAYEIVCGDMVGVHIRRTDHMLAKKLSPVKLFIKKMDEEITKNDSIKFFLSTDDADVENELIEKYGKQRIITQPNKIWGNSTKEEMVSGIIDCLCLSRCTKIYGSFSSQFSGFAAEYGKIPIEILKMED